MNCIQHYKKKKLRWKNPAHIRIMVKWTKKWKRNVKH